jgi:nitroreductase
MDVFDAVRARRSVRGYSSTPVPKEKLDRILESGRLAPSAMNLQPWHFIVVEDADKREEMSKARYAKFLKEAPVVIVGCGDKKSSPKWYAVDTTIALQNMVLTATSEELGTCWIGSFDEEVIRRLLKIPTHLAIVALLSLGYPRKKLDLAAAFVRAGNRKSMEEIVSEGEYGVSGKA